LANGNTAASSAINVPPIADAHHKHQQHGIVQFVHDTPVADARTVWVRTLHGFDVGRASWVDREFSDGLKNAATDLGIQRIARSASRS
jgi:hypothetical protein